jgi:hypothetical protein
LRRELHAHHAHTSFIGGGKDLIVCVDLASVDPNFDRSHGVILSRTRGIGKREIFIGGRIFFFLVNDPNSWW